MAGTIDTLLDPPDPLRPICRSLDVGVGENGEGGGGFEKVRGEGRRAIKGDGLVGESVPGQDRTKLLQFPISSRVTLTHARDL
jgi:hypothetical protein